MVFAWKIQLHYLQAGICLEIPLHTLSVGWYLYGKYHFIVNRLVFALIIPLHFYLLACTCLNELITFLHSLCILALVRKFSLHSLSIVFYLCSALCKTQHQYMIDRLVYDIWIDVFSVLFFNCYLNL